MKIDAYVDSVAEISKQLAKKILQEESDLSARARTIDGDIAGLVREIGLQTSKLVLQETCEVKVAKKSPRPETE